MHTLKTVYCALPKLYDTLEFEIATGSGEVHYSADIKVAQNVSLPFDSNNLIYKVLRAGNVFETLKRNMLDLTINLQKMIPVAGGLAGGSADAAATICALEDLGLLENVAPPQVAEAFIAQVTTLHLNAKIDTDTASPKAVPTRGLDPKFTSLGADINFAYFAARTLNNKLNDTCRPDGETPPDDTHMPNEKLPLGGIYDDMPATQPPYVLAIGTHFGEVLEPVDMNADAEERLSKSLELGITQTPYTISTKECYAKYDELLSRDKIGGKIGSKIGGEIEHLSPDEVHSNATKLVAMLKGEVVFEASQFARLLHNDLQLPALTLCPQLESDFKIIQSSSPDAFTFVSGSGPSIVTLRYSEK